MMLLYLRPIDFPMSYAAQIRVSKYHMKSLFTLTLCLTLSACSLTQQDSASDKETLSAPIDSQALLPCELEKTHPQGCVNDAQGVIAVIHPQQDVDVPLEIEQEADEVAPAIEDVWERVRLGLSMHIPNDKRVESQRRWYLRHPAYMQRVSNRARPFLYYIVEELEKHEMPLEIALLPIVESAFDPFAYSHGRASGMWQFIPGTGKNYGMKQTWWYDGRRDVIASTQGAIKYLQRLHKMFDGNWLHALAAYNSGEGRVMRAIRKNKRNGKATDFWSLNLPRETEAYVPKLLALADILAKQEQYQFAWPSIENKQVIEVVEIDSQIDLALAAKLAGLSTKELHALNPGYNRWATDPAGPHRLVVPLAKAESFKIAMAQTSAKDRLNWIRHEVRSGDSLGKLASQYHTSIDVIKRINNMRKSTIYVGDFLLVPVALKNLDEYALSSEQRLARQQSKQNGQFQLEHTVVKGDTLWDIARLYKVNHRSLAKWNGMAPTDPLKLGKRLVVWVNQKNSGIKTASVAQNGVMRKLTYTVRSGDSLARIANKFKVSVKDITRWNNINQKSYLQPGQRLKLIVDVTRT